jgi:starch phosphorylase
MAKNIIKFINSVADILNKDIETKDYIMLIFCPDYNVSNAEVIIPAADIS